MPLKFSLLADRTDAVPMIARWNFDEWGDYMQDDSVERVCDQLDEYMNRDGIRLMLPAVDGGEVIGTAQLKFLEMAEMFPDKEHWPGAISVSIIVARMCWSWSGNCKHKSTAQIRASDV